MSREHLTDPMHISQVLAETFDQDTPTTNCGTPGCDDWINPTESETTE